MPYSAKPIIYYDGYCHLCNGSIRFIIKRDKKKLFSFFPLQSENEIAPNGLVNKGKKAPDSIILVVGAKIFQKSTAVLRILKIMGFPWNMLYAFIIVPRFIRDPIYMFISRNRYAWFGKRDECFLVS